MLAEGSPAPGFTVTNDDGKSVTLNDFKGKKLVIYFYPKDDTPGCTKEACGFRDVYDQILAKGAAVVGVSADSEASHAKFRSKFDLPFHLLSDPDKTMIKAYDAWGEKKNYGKTYEGILRSTVVIDENGKIIKLFPKVKPDQHAEEILELLG